jgi:adenylate cyclase class IV
VWVVQLSEKFNLPNGGEVDAFFRFPETDFLNRHELLRIRFIVSIIRHRGFVNDPERAFPERF